jgi:hypothetical protein
VAEFKTVLTLSAQGDKLSGTWHALNFLGQTSAEMWLFKLLMMLFDLLFAFFSFAMAVRIFHHIGYLINVPLDKAVEAAQIRQVVAHINRAGTYYRIGMRAYYFTVPLLFWLFGPTWMLGATLAMLYFMFHLDRAPKRDTDLMGGDLAWLRGSELSRLDQKAHPPFTTPTVHIQPEGQFDVGGQGLGAAKPDAIHRFAAVFEFELHVFFSHQAL